MVSYCSYTHKRKLPNMRILLILYVLYYVCDLLFPAMVGGVEVENNSNRIYPQTCMGIIFVYSLYFIMKNYKRLIINIVTRPFIYYLLFVAIYIFFTNGQRTLFDNFVQFMKITLAICTFFSFYLGLASGMQNAKYLYVIFWIMFFYALFSLVKDYYVIMVAEMDKSAEGFDSNSGFLLASLIPMSIIMPFKYLKIGIYFFVLVACMFSGQRAAAVGAFVTLPVVLKYFKQFFVKKDFVLLLIFAIISLVIALPFISNSIENFILRADVDSNRGDIGSGRSIFWSLAINSFFSGNPFNMLLGHGYFAINDMLEQKYGLAIGAHNGFIDHLYTFGIVGLLLYVSIYFVLYKQYVLLKNSKSDYSSIVLIMLLMLILRSATSHGWFDISYMPFFMTFSIIMANKKKESIYDVTK